jgi:hypothetical protein
MTDDNTREALAKQIWDSANAAVARARVAGWNEAIKAARAVAEPAMKYERLTDDALHSFGQEYQQLRMKAESVNPGHIAEAYAQIEGIATELETARATIAAQAAEIERLKAERTTKECDHVWIYITNTTAPHRYCDKCGKRSNHV